MAFASAPADENLGDLIRQHVCGLLFNGREVERAIGMKRCVSRGNQAAEQYTSHE